MLSHGFRWATEDTYVTWSQSDTGLHTHFSWAWFMAYASEPRHRETSPPQVPQSLVGPSSLRPGELG